MAGKYSIHDTHRLPYNNAKITAKQLSDSTTPVRFRTFTGEVIGLEVRTNSRGYCCQSDGTPYVDGVFVEEDAIVTAVMSDGTSTSWTVGSESDVAVFDGQLYGRVIEDPSDYSDDDVVIGTTHYKKLFSANQKTDSPLSLEDLANVPSFNKWTEDQQIERFDVAAVTNSTSVYLKAQTKVLILMNDNADGQTQTYPKEFIVWLHATLDDQHKTRFGRNFSVINLTGMAISLKNADGAQDAIGVVQHGAGLEVAETYPAATSGSDIGGTAVFTAVDNRELASNGGVSYTIPSNATNETGNRDYIVLNDSTPPILNITDVQNATTAPIKPVMLKYEGSNGTFRRIVLRRFDAYNRPLRIDNELGEVLGILPPLGDIEITVSRDTDGNAHEGNVNNIKHWIQYQSIDLLVNDKNYVAAGIGSVTVNAASATSSFTSYKSSLVFSRGVSESYRIEFAANPVPCWIQLEDEAGLVGESFCVPAQGGRVTVQNIYGVLRIIEKSWTDFAVTSTYDDNNWRSEFESFDAIADLAYLATQTSEIFAFDRGNHDQDLYLKFPIVSGQTALVRVKMPFYSSTIESGNADTHLRIGDLENNNTAIDSLVLFNDRKMDEDSFIAGGWTLTGTLTRSGSTITFTQISVEPYK